MYGTHTDCCSPGECPGRPKLLRSSSAVTATAETSREAGPSYRPLLCVIVHSTH